MDAGSGALLPRVRSWRYSSRVIVGVTRRYLLRWGGGWCVVFLCLSWMAMEDRLVGSTGTVSNEFAEG